MLLNGLVFIALIFLIVPVAFTYIKYPDSIQDTTDWKLLLSKSIKNEVSAIEYIADYCGLKINKVMSYIDKQALPIYNDETSIEYVFNKDNALCMNPERGFYSSSSIKLGENGSGSSWTNTKSEISNLLYLKVDLSDFSGNMNGSQDKPLTDKAIHDFRSTLESIKQNNNTIILRFVYDGMASGMIDDKQKVEPEQSTILEHIGQLSDTFKDYQSTINVIQVGFYGLWGETSFNTDVNSHPEYYKEITEALLKATEGTDITIALRSPSYYAIYKDIDIKNICYDTDDEYDCRVGVFNDGYGGSYNDLGTYTNRSLETEWLSSRACSTFYGGEVVADNSYDSDIPYTAIGDYNTGMYFIEEAFKIHTSYLGWEWDQSVHKQWKQQLYEGDDVDYKDVDVLMYIENHLGYRFVLEEVDAIDRPVTENSVSTSIKIKNVGFGNIFKKKRADIILTDSNGVTIKEYTGVNLDAREFLSQTSVERSIDVELPELNSGEYKLYLRISTGELLRNGKYYGAIMFANQGIYDDALEANYIAAFTI